MDILTDILIILIFAIVILWLGLKAYEIYKLEGLRGLIIKLIVKAENIFEQGMNTEKFDSVFNGVYNKFPAILKKFISAQNVKDFIQEIFDEIKVALDNKPKE